MAKRELALVTEPSTRLQIVRFDGTAFSFDDRPYVIMKNQAYVSLGQTR